jgi:hypothetical protein
VKGHGLAYFRAAGVEFREVAGRLEYRLPPRRTDPNLAPMITERRADFLRELRAEEGSARLAYHLQLLCSALDRQVLTPRGRGLLWQVFSDRVGVVIKAGTVSFFHPTEVEPPQKDVYSSSDTEAV